jgi:hypothetical protein
MPTRNPQAVRQHASDAARQRTGQPTTPPLDPVFVALNPGALPSRKRSPAELSQWIRGDEEYAILGANVVVELYGESHARKPITRAWAITRRAWRDHRRHVQRTQRGDHHRASRASEPAASANPTNQSLEWQPILVTQLLRSARSRALIARYRAAIPPGPDLDDLVGEMPVASSRTTACGGVTKL